MWSDELRNGLLEFYHKLDCAQSARVREFITLQGLQGQIYFHDVDAEDGAIERLAKISGRREVPSLVIEGSALFEFEQIIRWLDANLVHRKAAEIFVEPRQTFTAADN